MRSEPSGRPFHRGIQAESTWRVILEKETHYQRLAESRPWRAGFFCGIQGIQFVEATTPEASQRKPPAMHLQNSGLTRDGEAFAPRRIGTSLAVGCDATSAAHIACGVHPDPAASSAPDGEGREKRMPLLVAEDRLDLCDGFDVA